MKSFLSGGIAAIVSKSIIAPIERVKYMYIVTYVLFQTRSKVFTYKLFFTDFMYIIEKHGILNLWRGNTMNILKVFPHAAIVIIKLFRTLPYSTTSEPTSTKTMAQYNKNCVSSCVEPSPESVL